MTGRRRVLIWASLTIAFAFSTALRPVDSSTRGQLPARLRCTQEALAAIRRPPKLEYECEEQEAETLKSPVRRAALKNYLQQIEATFSDARWWATSVDELNACAATGEARALTDEEQRSYENGERSLYLYGDGAIRLVATEDPCIVYSYGTLNAYLLERAGNRVYATQVLNAYFTRLDAALDLHLAELNGEKIIIVETNTSDGMMPPSPYTTWYAYTIDPRSHRAIPKDLFREGRKLTHRFRYDDYVLDDEKLASQWRAPQLVRDGKLSPRFYVCFVSKRRMLRRTYVFNGRYYAAH